MTDRVLRRKWRITIIGSILLVLVFTPPFMKEYDNWADKMANPGYLGPGSPEYAGAFYSFWVSGDWPKSKIIINFNTSVHDTNLTIYPETDDQPPMAFSCASYWRVSERFGPDMFERVRISLYWFVVHYEPKYNITPGYVYYAPFGYELAAYDSWLSEPEYYDPVNNLTLHFEYQGWI